MVRYVVRIGAALTVVALACTTPTVCACTPARSAVVVSGTLTDASGEAVAGARLLFASEPQGRPPAQVMYYEYIGAPTSASGAFQGKAYGWSPGTLELHVGVVQAGRADTVKLTAGLAQFRPERDPLDTVRLSLRLP